MIEEKKRTGTFLSTFTYLFERMGMSQAKFAEYINTQPLPDDLKDDPRYRHPLPLHHTTIGRILSGSIPDADTLYRIARLAWEYPIETCNKLEDMRWEAYLLSQEEKRERITQQLVAIRKEPEPKTVEKKRDLPVPDWVLS